MEKVTAATLSECFLKKKELPSARYIAGGTEDLRLKAERPSAVIPLTGLIERKAELRGEEVFLSSALTFSDLESSPIVPAPLKEAAGKMASRALKNAATLGGNIASRRADSYLIPVLLAYGAKLVVFSDREKTCELSKYVNRSCDCIILGVLIDPLVKVVTRRESLTSSSHAAVTSALSGKGYFTAVSGGSIYSSAEEALSADIKDDITGSAAYKKYLVKENYEILKEALNG